MPTKQEVTRAATRDRERESVYAGRGVASQEDEAKALAVRPFYSAIERLERESEYLEKQISITVERFAFVTGPLHSPADKVSEEKEYPTSPATARLTSVSQRLAHYGEILDLLVRSSEV